METDRYGLAVTTSSSKAAAAYRRGVDLLLSAWPGAEDSFLEATAEDPGFALAHAALARHLQIYSRMAQARETMARAHGLVATASAREAAHVRILGLAIEGQPAKALAALLEHLEACPRDALACSLPLGAFGLYGLSRRADHDAVAGRTSPRARQLRHQNAHGPHAPLPFFADAAQRAAAAKL